jgi:DNA-binding Lrp family transcriptional regulator
MEKLRSLDYKLLWELMKNSRRSDRQLARVLKTSQPTVTRRRARLEKQVIDGYTAIPKWEKIGYEILAITLIKAVGIFSSKEYSDIRKQGLGWLSKQPAIIMGGACEGMGMNSFIISVHKNYSDHSKFMLKLRLEMGDFIDEVQTILVDLRGAERLKPFHLKYLANAELSQPQRASR